MLFGLLSFAGPAAAGAVFTMGVVCLYTGFSIPIAARHLGGRKFVPGPFTLGKLVRKLELNPSPSNFMHINPECTNIIHRRVVHVVHDHHSDFSIKHQSRC